MSIQRIAPSRSNRQVRERSVAAGASLAAVQVRKQASAGRGLEPSDSSDTVSQSRSVCGNPETPKERVP